MLFFISTEVEMVTIYLSCFLTVLSYHKTFSGNRMLLVIFLAEMDHQITTALGYR